MVSLSKLYKLMRVKMFQFLYLFNFLTYCNHKQIKESSFKKSDKLEYGVVVCG